MSAKLNRHLLHTILACQSHSRETRRMTRLIARAARRMGATVDVVDGNVYAVKGNGPLYPCMVAHTDTVHDIIPNEHFKVMLKDGMYFGWNTAKDTHAGIGGDDKVGIFAALSALERYDNIKVAFFRDEEIGCIGSKAANMRFFDDVTLILQCDRNGKHDFVDRIYGVDLQSYEFKKAVKPILDKYGYKPSGGALTDVYQLKINRDAKHQPDGANVCVANMSCGYFNPHSDREFIDVRVMANTINMCFEIIDTLGGQKWEHKSVDSFRSARWEDDEWGYGSYGRSFYAGSRTTSTFNGTTHARSGGTGNTQRVANTVGRYANARVYEFEGEVPTCQTCAAGQEAGYDCSTGMYYCVGCRTVIGWGFVTV